jgi:ribosome-binding ATPase
MTIIIGIVGKPSSGKSTFLNAACLTNAKVSEIPFTTIDPNKGVAYVKIDCLCQKLNIEDNPQNSICIDGKRFIPINLLDVAGLVPDAHKGKGLGNRFLSDLSKTDALLHIVDISGSLDKMGKRTGEGSNDPYEDVVFLENEINLWFTEILKREDWEKFLKNFSREKGKFIDELYNRLSGVKINKKQIINALKKADLENLNPNSWSENDLKRFSSNLREISKPFIIIANKIDKEIAEQKYHELTQKIDAKIFPCSALAEYVLREYSKKEIIEYLQGSDHFKIVKKDLLNQKEEETLNNIQEKILDQYGSTGVQQIINYAVFKIIDQICIYPVSDVNNYTDNDGNILPDCFLIKKGTTLIEFVRDKIHTELADKFMFGIDAISKKRLGENYILQNNDVIKIVTSK